MQSQRLGREPWSSKMHEDIAINLGYNNKIGFSILIVDLYILIKIWLKLYEKKILLISGFNSYNLLFFAGSLVTKKFSFTHFKHNALADLGDKLKNS